MPAWRRSGLVGLACALVFACAPQQPSLTPEQTIALLGTGQPLLSCREPCLDAWRSGQPEAAGLLARGRWRDLAVLVTGIGYQDDLSTYYLGRAAQGLGYRAAAISYYRQSTELSGTSIGCAYLSRQCGGVSLPRAASARLAALLHPSRHPARGGGQPAPAEPEPGPSDIGPVSGPASAAPTGAGDFIEPPPASR